MNWSELVSDLVPVVAIIGAGFFALLRWIDLRRREVADDEFEKVFRLIMIVTGQHPGGAGARIVDQIAAVWMLKKFPKYSDVIVRSLDIDYTAVVSSPTFNSHVEPHIRQLVEELKNRKS